ncbi:MAG: PEP-CTERM sorting domain-containing protein [Planctomycetota bacterium]
MRHITESGLTVAAATVVLGVAMLLPTTANAGVIFADDFTIFDTSEWTHHGSNAVNVDDTIPDAVSAYGAVDWSPASRITHPEATSTGDFDVQFDIKRLAYNGSGSLGIGWMNVNEFASVQDHSNYQNLYGWETHDREGTPSSGLFVSLNSGSGDGGGDVHRSFLTASNNGSIYDYTHFDPGPVMAGQVWLTMNFGRTGTKGYFEATYRDSGIVAIDRIDIDVPVQANYDYFHISSIDGMSNSWWVDFEIDNLQLTPEPTALSLMALGSMVMILCRRRLEQR